jgi:hypothetical protein
MTFVRLSIHLIPSLSASNTEAVEVENHSAEGGDCHILELVFENTTELDINKKEEKPLMTNQGWEGGSGLVT